MSTDDAIVCDDEIREAHARVLETEREFERRRHPSPLAEREYRRALTRFHGTVARKLGLPLLADELAEEAAE